MFAHCATVTYLPTEGEVELLQRDLPALQPGPGPARPPGLHCREYRAPPQTLLRLPLYRGFNTE